MQKGKASHIFFNINISIYAIFNDQSFNDTLTNDIVCFEQLGPRHLKDTPNHAYLIIGQGFLSAC